MYMWMFLYSQQLLVRSNDWRLVSKRRMPSICRQLHIAVIWCLLQIFNGIYGSKIPVSFYLSHITHSGKSRQLLCCFKGVLQYTTLYGGPICLVVGPLNHVSTPAKPAPSTMWLPGFLRSVSDLLSPPVRIAQLALHSCVRLMQLLLQQCFHRIQLTLHHSLPLAQHDLLHCFARHKSCSRMASTCYTLQSGTKTIGTKSGETNGKQHAAPSRRDCWAGESHIAQRNTVAPTSVLKATPSWLTWPSGASGRQDDATQS